MKKFIGIFIFISSMMFSSYSPANISMVCSGGFVKTDSMSNYIDNNRALTVIGLEGDIMKIVYADKYSFHGRGKVTKRLKDAYVGVMKDMKTGRVLGTLVISDDSSTAYFEHVSGLTYAYAKDLHCGKNDLTS